ncbi:TPA: hypothetical protein N0F65_006355 [Lagenidium giganteum]|uniref:Uncharacterized protein n=1 Tax=Lagenidium giganteum TaxID=4803 RepID=A0AAV2YHV9_9STRA|nr:TPA: hypothetical protein N0F65_006355 [Lagenidium giganteum]
MQTTVNIVPALGSDSKDSAGELHGQVHVHVQVAHHLPIAPSESARGFFDNVCSPHHQLHDAKSSVSKAKDDDKHDGVDDEMHAWLGAWIWIIVRLAPVGQLDPEDARVQYQFTPWTESYVFSVDHTNAIKVLVTEELMAHVSTHLLQFNFLSPPPAPPAPAPVATAMEPMQVAPPAREVDVTPVEVPAPAPAEVKEPSGLPLEQAMALASELEAARHAAAAAAREHELRLQAKDALLDEAQRARERDRTDWLNERKRHDEVTQHLENMATQLEEQKKDKQHLLSNVQDHASKTDQAFELLKQRMAADAKEREELQRRLNALEEEKLELMKKSRVCVLQ